MRGLEKERNKGNKETRETKRMMVRVKGYRRRRIEMRRMRRCFTWFPIGGLGEPNI